MLLPLVLYNLAMAVIDALLLARLAHRRTALRLVEIGLIAPVMGFSLMLFCDLVFHCGTFTLFRLAACGLFAHGLVLLVASVLLLRRVRPRTAVVAAVAGVGLLGICVDAFLIEPTWLEVSRVRLTSAKVSRPLRIVLLADLQTDECGAYERAVLRRVREEEPDVILLAGDYLHVHGSRREELRREMNAFLREIEFGSSASTYAVRGNIDADDWAALFAGLNVTTVESGESFEVGGVRLTCLSERDSGNGRLQVESVDQGTYHVVLGHRPDYALGRIDADLLLAGHTHGGQVRLPFLGPILTLSSVPRRWAVGQSDLPGGQTLYVSRGVGMERGGAPRIRFLCRPELVVIDILPQ